MIYLIESTYYNKKTGEITDLLKIGYTDDSTYSRRMAAYKLHNPMCEVLCTIPDQGEDIERRLHQKFHEFHYPDYGNEWFYYDQSIVDYIKARDFSDLSLTVWQQLRELQKSIVKEIEDVYKTSFPDIDYSTLKKAKTFRAVLSILEQKYPDQLTVKEDFTELGILREKYCRCSTIPTKLKLLCSVSPDLMYRYLNRYLSNSDKVKFILLALPQKKVVALGYDTSKINKEIQVKEGLKKIDAKIMLNFSVGDHYSNTYVAAKLQEIYNKAGIETKAKATDIRKWFEAKDLKLQDKTLGKRVHGLKLIKLL